MRLLRVLFSVILLCQFSSCSHTKNLVTGSGDGYYPLPGAGGIQILEWPLIIIKIKRT